MRLEWREEKMVKNVSEAGTRGRRRQRSGGVWEVENVRIGGEADKFMRKMVKWWEMKMEEWRDTQVPTTVKISVFSSFLSCIPNKAFAVAANSCTAARQTQKEKSVSTDSPLTPHPSPSLHHFFFFPPFSHPHYQPAVISIPNFLSLIIYLINKLLVHPLAQQNSVNG